MTCWPVLIVPTELVRQMLPPSGTLKQVFRQGEKEISFIGRAPRGTRTLWIVVPWS